MLTRTLLALCVLCSTLFAGAQRTLFRDSSSYVPLAWLDVFKQGEGLGYLYMGGWAFPLGRFLFSCLLLRA